MAIGDGNPRKIFNSPTAVIFKLRIPIVDRVENQISTLNPTLAGVAGAHDITQARNEKLFSPRELGSRLKFIRAGPPRPSEKYQNRFLDQAASATLFARLFAARCLSYSRCFVQRRRLTVLCPQLEQTLSCVRTPLREHPIDSQARAAGSPHFGHNPFRRAFFWYLRARLLDSFIAGMKYTKRRACKVDSIFSCKWTPVELHRSHAEKSVA